MNQKTEIIIDRVRPGVQCNAFWQWISGSRRNWDPVIYPGQCLVTVPTTALTISRLVRPTNLWASRSLPG